MNIFKDFKEYPGYYLNLIVMIGCIGFSIYQIYETKKTHDKEMAIFKASVEKTLSEKMYNNHVNIGKISDDIIIAIDVAVTKDYHAAKNASITRESRYADFKEKIGYSKYLNEDIKKIVNETHHLNKEEKIMYLYNKTNEYVVKETPFLVNEPIIWVWIVTASIYLILVSILYKGEKIANEEKDSESLLNIVDIGFYLALIQFTGGLNTHKGFYLAIIMAVFVAIIDFDRIRKEVINKRFNGGIRHAIIHNNTLIVLRSFSPNILYLIVLSSGLIWASISHIDCGRSYWSMYFTLLIILSVSALSLHFFIFTINLIINRNSK